MNVLIVESPAKAKTINKYLGSDYTVLASFGHVRDLLPKDGSVKPDEDFEMVYQVDTRSSQYISAIVKAVKSADKLYLATDPDREGEAISWHVLSVLEEKKALKNVEVHRVTFNQITKNSVLEAIANPRKLDIDLVNAQQARRALDYLVGFTISPILWRKLPGAKSAGRVQSVALRLVCEREDQISRFIRQEYWSIEAELKTGENAPIIARLTHYGGDKLDKFSIPNEDKATQIVTQVSSAQFQVKERLSKETKRQPAPPFMTSTLQQEASRKLGFNAKRTMDVAQRLYEGVQLDGEVVGLITYMRTDGLYIAPEAIKEARDVIAKEFGAPYLPEKPRFHKSKVKNPQESHEAIRPIFFTYHPKDVARFLDKDQLSLYTLIWKRCLASQMENARLQNVTINIAALSEDRGEVAEFRATGSTLLFDGFLKVYMESRDDEQESATAKDQDRLLPMVQTGDRLLSEKITPRQHYTEPPARYTEASLVKKMEELGVGRPSTYASILSVLRDRSYVEMEQKRYFVPSNVGWLVTTFLVHFFGRYFDYDFTAKLEEQLDDIAEQRAEWRSILHDFWRQFSRSEDEQTLSVKDSVELIDKIIGNREFVTQVINDELGVHFFPVTDSDVDPRKCTSCGEGRLMIKPSRNGGFIGCSSYPDCRYTRPLDVNKDGEGDGGGAYPKVLGIDPETSLEISLCNGPYGKYLQLGVMVDNVKPKRFSIPKNVDPSEIGFEQALEYLALPRVVGTHPETSLEIKTDLGRYGPYVLHNKKYVSLKSHQNVLTIILDEAVVLITEAASKQTRSSALELRSLGDHPAEGGVIKIMDGRYGPYISYGKVNATLPKDMEIDYVTLEQAVELIAAKMAQAGKKAPAKKAPAKKAAPKKAAPKKTASKKAPETKATETKAPAKKAPAKKAASKKAPETKAPETKAPAKKATAKKATLKKV